MSRGYPFNNPYNPYQQFMQQQSPQQLKAQQQVKFEPSKSLRDHVDDRLKEQHECLADLGERINRLTKAANAGRSMGNGKGPGDEQIGGDAVAGMKKKFENDVMSNVLGPYYGARGRMRGAMPPDPFPMPPGSMPPWMNQGQGDDDDEEAQGEDPFLRYMRLDREIDMLVTMSSVPANGMPMFPFTMSDMDSPPWEMREQMLANILGPGGKKGKGGGGGRNSGNSMATARAPQYAPPMGSGMPPPNDPMSQFINTGGQEGGGG